MSTPDRSVVDARGDAAMIHQIRADAVHEPVAAARPYAHPCFRAAFTLVGGAC